MSRQRVATNDRFLFATRTKRGLDLRGRTQVPSSTSVIPLALRLRSPPILVAPGVYDPLSARIAEQAGAEAVFVSGAMVAMSQYALPDFGLGTATELVDLVARIADRVSVPVLVDGDQGFGNAAHVQRFVRGLNRAGAAAVQIEDQLPVKPSSDLRARPLVSKEEMVGKLRAALDARDGLLISARTDALSATNLDDALDRAEAYVAAGCDLMFFEGVKTLDDVSAIVAQFGGRVALVHNLLEGGTPFSNADDAGDAGFALGLFPATGLGAAARGMREAYTAIADRSASDGVERFSLAELNDIVGTGDMAARMARYGLGE